jgi:hypothetical protein
MEASTVTGIHMMPGDIRIRTSPTCITVTESNTQLHQRMLQSNSEEKMSNDLFTLACASFTIATVVSFLMTLTPRDRDGAESSMYIFWNVWCWVIWIYLGVVIAMAIVEGLAANHLTGHTPYDVLRTMGLTDVRVILFLVGFHFGALINIWRKSFVSRA